MLKQTTLTIAQCAWFYLPAAIANIAPVLFTFIKWNRPIWEHGLGPNKTWRGLIAGITLATLTLLLQKSLSTQGPVSAISILPYQEQSVLWLGLLFGSGALIGDASKSYFKRLRAIPSGAKWWPFDQIDFIVGSTLFVSLAFWPGWYIVATALVLTMFLHPVINQIGYRLGLKEVPW
jgi:CDP-2,3-bis-(O-geranylgeranyl)-sn-glycerol synthase